MSRPGPRARPLAEITEPVRERVVVDIDEGTTLPAADLLRLLDRLRQQLSRHLIGSTGAFIGYDSLTVHRWALSGPGRVLVEASLAHGRECRGGAALVDRHCGESRARSRAAGRAVAADNDVTPGPTSGSTRPTTGRSS